jgi:hypothetical protein
MALRKAPHPERDPEPSAKGSSRRTQGRRSNSPANNFTRSQDEVDLQWHTETCLILSAALSLGEGEQSKDATPVIQLFSR